MKLGPTSSQRRLVKEESAVRTEPGAGHLGGDGDRKEKERGSVCGREDRGSEKAKETGRSGDRKSRGHETGRG